MTPQIGADTAATSSECRISVSVDVDPIELPAVEMPPWTAYTIVITTGAATSNAATMQPASNVRGGAPLFARRLRPKPTRMPPGWPRVTAAPTDGGELEPRSESHV